MAIALFIGALISFISALNSNRPIVYNLIGYTLMLAGYYELYF